MNPLLIIAAIQGLLTLAPQLIVELRLLLAKGDPTPEDWDALRLKVSKSYDDYIAQAQGDPPL